MCTATRVYRSADNGFTWQSCFHSTNDRIGAICFFGNRVFLNLGSNFAYSDNLGSTWTIKALPSNIGYGGLAIGYNQGRIFLATNAGIAISDDEGTTWTLKLVTASNALGFVFCDKQVFVTDGNTGEFNSIDNGDLWAPMDSGLNISQCSNYPCIILAQDELILSGGCQHSDLYRMANSCNQTSAVKSIFSESKSVYPNPAFDFLGLPTDAKPEGILLLDVQGRGVSQFKVKDVSKIDVTSLAPGVYFIQYVDNYGNEMKCRFVKQ